MNTSLARRRAVLSGLAALAFSAVALTGCTGESDGQAAATTSETPTTPTPSATSEKPASPTPSDAGTDPAATPVPASTAPWAGTKQFVQIEEAWTTDGETYLSVRPAQKEAITEPHERWVITPGEGRYTRVPMAEDARVLLSVPLGDAKHAASYSQAELVSRLMAQPSSARAGIGYDVSFDGEGRVTKLQTLYRS